MILRTQETHFSEVKNYPFSSHHFEVENGLNMHYVDEGKAENPVVLLLHGEPTWSYLYRKMIPILVNKGFRIIVPDLIGFGKSDKFSEKSSYSYQGHITWVKSLLQGLKLSGIHLFCQDWGGLIGLRILADHPDLFVKAVASNTFLPTGQTAPPEAFFKWQAFSKKSSDFIISRVVQMGSALPLSPEDILAYDAPFPSEEHKAGARIFPSLVPTESDDPEAINNQLAWKKLATFKKPFLTVFGDQDPITKGGEKYFQKVIPGAKNQPHQFLSAGHFIQEDQGESLAEIIGNFYLQKH